jgi:hypothetical protein
MNHGVGREMGNSGRLPFLQQVFMLRRISLAGG